MANQSVKRATYPARAISPQDSGTNRERLARLAESLDVIEAQQQHHPGFMLDIAERVIARELDAIELASSGDWLTFCATLGYQEDK